MKENSKYLTYEVVGSELPGVPATLIIDSLSAQKHFLLNTVLKTIDAAEKKRIKNSEDIEFKGLSYDEETIELIKSSEVLRYVVFTTAFRGKACPADQIIAWTKKRLTAFKSKQICLFMEQTCPGIIPQADGIRIRPALGLERKDSTISLRNVNGKLPMVRVYLMIIGAENAL